MQIDLKIVIFTAKAGDEPQPAKHAAFAIENPKPADPRMVLQNKGEIGCDHPVHLNPFREVFEERGGDQQIPEAAQAKRENPHRAGAFRIRRTPPCFEKA